MKLGQLPDTLCEKQEGTNTKVYWVLYLWFFDGVTPSTLKKETDPIALTKSVRILKLYVIQLRCRVFLNGWVQSTAQNDSIDSAR